MSLSVRAARLASGKTQAEVAKETGITERGYQDFESREEYPAIQTGIRIAQALNSTVEELFGAATPNRVNVKGDGDR